MEGILSQGSGIGDRGSGIGDRGSGVPLQLEWGEMPAASLQVLSTLDELDAAITHSADRPVVIFKHSSTCGTSAQAHESIVELLAETAVGAEWYVVLVQASRQVSNAIAERFGVRHESPQVLIIDAGRVVWHASHFRVTGAALQAALERLSTATSAPESASR